VNTTARICGIAGGGQVLASRNVRAALDEERAAALTSIGPRQLRGIAGEHELFEVALPAA
jgi:class 3 adenylate cyclase